MSGSNVLVDDAWSSIDGANWRKAQRAWVKF